jgi:hypothetical protein
LKHLRTQESVLSLRSRLLGRKKTTTDKDNRITPQQGEDNKGAGAVVIKAGVGVAEDIKDEAAADVDTKAEVMSAESHGPNQSLHDGTRAMSWLECPMTNASRCGTCAAAENPSGKLDLRPSTSTVIGRNSSINYHRYRRISHPTITCLHHILWDSHLPLHHHLLHTMSVLYITTNRPTVEIVTILLSIGFDKISHLQDRHDSDLNCHLISRLWLLASNTTYLAIPRGRNSIHTLIHAAWEQIQLCCTTITER